MNKHYKFCYIFGSNFEDKKMQMLVNYQVNINS